MDLIRDVGFNAAFSFLYSPRPGTPAANMADEVPHDVKTERLHRLQAFVTAQSSAHAQSWLGSVQRVLVEGESRKDEQELAGRMDNNRIVNFPGMAEMAGRFVNVKITAVSAYTLRGEQVL